MDELGDRERGVITSKTIPSCSQVSDDLSASGPLCVHTQFAENGYVQFDNFISTLAYDLHFA